MTVNPLNFLFNYDQRAHNHISNPNPPSHSLKRTRIREWRRRNCQIINESLWSNEIFFWWQHVTSLSVFFAEKNTMKWDREWKRAQKSMKSRRMTWTSKDGWVITLKLIKTYDSNHCHLMLIWWLTVYRIVNAMRF